MGKRLQEQGRVHLEFRFGVWSLRLRVDGSGSRARTSGVGFRVKDLRV
jgi:hypothetical protein